MSLTVERSELEKLSVSERLELIGLLWDSLSETEPVAPEWHRAEVMRRRAAADADPGAGARWHEVRARLTGSA